MSYSSEVSDIFRSYSIILEEGIPSILSLVNKGRMGSLITIQNDKSVSITKSLGDKVIDSLEKQEELKTLFNTVNSVLESLDSASRLLLTEYYCNHRTLSEALEQAGYKSQAAMEYARALFAFHHPNINLTEKEFTQICSDLAGSADQAVRDEISVREQFAEFKSRVLETPENYFELANSLENLETDNSNCNFLQECSLGNVKFWRRRNQLLLGMFYLTNQNVDFNVILDLLKEGQGQKKFMQRLHKKLHPEQF